ncbi:dTDP-4-dehydrorhamnose reductase [Neisseria dumasiana]|uniref:dTDP-4-dehydrorhamnose reductase n=1 Tax=Neisseria dumasiana TaxID=1931275 RepID=A0ABX3WPW6_9NEIS|nr:dTDP-4-dehydrorhamnose reductase [Neisseria dumasiana]OSI37171.1 dTDP-4-dehydrorhamnose reductase [Neisseria dumasiana]UOO83710.1 dTDP-4-dehydrorhamnose reductase [Neisseria dumasiana]
MAKFLITGKNGQVGHCLTRLLAQRSDQVSALHSAQLDITDRDAVFQTALSFRPDIIINAAAYTAVDKAESDSDRAFAVNRNGAAYLAEAAQACGAAIIHLSTDYVFDGQKQQPYSETDTPSPQSVYGASKLAGEQAVQAACSRAVIIRTSWVFGEHGHNFVKTMLRLGKERDTLNIVGDQYGAPTYAGDIAATLIHIGRRLSQQDHGYGLYHYSGSPYVSWYQFAQAIFDAAAAQGLLDRIPELIEIDTASYPTPAKRPACSRLNTHNIQTAFGVQPSNWQAALHDLCPYMPAP